MVMLDCDPNLSLTLWADRGPLPDASYLAHPYHAALGQAEIFAMEQGLDSDHESRLLKKSDNVHVDLDPDSFSGSLIELMIMPRDGHQAA